MSLGVALLGAGIFARSEYIPALQASKSFNLKAIYSRSKASAESLSNTLEGKVETYFDLPASNLNSLSALLARQDVHAVIVALPILVQGGVIKKVLAAGKHVLSEKPIAKDVKTAVELINWHEADPHNNVWCVAENFRFIPTVVHGVEQIKKLSGEVLTFSMNMFTLIAEDDKFFQTKWRQVPGYQGGFLLDGGVHFIAALRQLLGAANQDITKVTANTRLLHPRLPVLDSVHALIQIRNGNSGTFGLSFGTEYFDAFEFRIVTDKGAVIVTDSMVKTVSRDSEGRKIEEVSEYEWKSGLGTELETFHKSIKNGNAHPKISPRESLGDLLILQRMLESSDEGSAIVVEMKHD